MPPERILSLLAASPARLVDLTGGVDEARLRTARVPGEWSCLDVIAHLRACADVWGAAMLTILDSPQPSLRAVDPRTWMRQTDYPDLPFRESLAAFHAQRRQLLAVLEPLDQEGWSRSALVTGAGRPLQRTVAFYAQWLARHERSHVKQVERILRA